MTRRGACGAALAMVGAAAGLAAQEVHRQSFELFVPAGPVPVAVEGAPALVYELHMTNFADEPLRITRLEVAGAGAPEAVLAAFEGEELAGLMGHMGPADPARDPLTVAPGARAVAYLWLGLGDAGQGLAALVHHVGFRTTVGEGAGSEGRVSGGVTAIATSSPPVLGPPLRGGPWVAVYLPDEPRGHRRVTFALEGRVHIPARFAIDWMKIDEEGALTAGDPSRVDSFLGYGAEVLAVADATVVAVRNTMAESPTVDHVRHGLDEETGNHVTLDLGDGRFVSYEHLRPGSVRVARGETVVQGQVIAELGYTGDSTGPHLHMHVSDGSAPLLGEGLPFVFSSFEVLGRYEFGRPVGTWIPRDGGAETRTLELPAANAIVRF